MSNPYKGLPSYCFWSQAMTSPGPGLMDPVVRSRTIGAQHKIATMGSCFAQHLAKYIQDVGRNYYIAETAPKGMDATTAGQRNYGVFSARYGNVYTVRQAVQLFDRAFGAFTPVDDVWEKHGKFVDAFRPRIEPDGLETINEVKKSALEHLKHVRDVFTRSDWLIFTLGLTEAWCSKQDGSVYPLAPGVAGGSFDSKRYEFINFTAREVQEDLEQFIEKIRAVNSRLRIILTVSPVPLIATYERRHVWVSTTYSKAALRIAADQIERSFKGVFYFPSYEIVTAPDSRYYADDLRQVTAVGVKQVMKIFGRHFFEPSRARQKTRPARRDPIASEMDREVVCDEEVIETALRESGF